VGGQTTIKKNLKMASASKYDVNAIRTKLKQSMSGKFMDPDEFKPDKAKSTTDAIKYRFFILPPLLQGDILKSGEVEKSMQHFFVSHANHWVNDRPHPCTRVWDDDVKCPICQFGFDLLKEEKYKNQGAARTAVIKTWMPTQYSMVNIFFTNWKNNPEELRGTVKTFNASKTLFDQWASTLMKDNKGDPEDPEAWGIFFDENAAFVYELQVLKQGRQNNYKTSKFLPNDGNPMPMIRKDGKAVPEKLEELLQRRHNIWDKIEIPNEESIGKIYNTMVEGDDDDPDDNGGFDEDETTAKVTTVAKVTTTAKTKEKAKKSTKAKEVDEDEDDDEDVVTHLADDDDAEESLADETPLSDDTDDDDPDGDAPEPAKEEPAKEPAKEATAEAAGDDDDSDEIDDLLSQLDDDDD